MNFDHRHYVPLLRWKQGEYLGVSQLPDTTKQALTPLIEIPPKGYDFEEKREKKTIDKHLKPVAKRVYKKWGNSPCFIDLSLIESAERMETGIHPVSFVFDELREMKCPGIPVTGLNRDAEYQSAVRTTSTNDKSGICLRVTIDQAAKSSFKKDADSLLSTLGIQPSDCDLILDLGAPNFVPLGGFTMTILPIVAKLPYLNDWRSFTILGTSFPETMAGIKIGGEVVPRYEWRLYKILVASFRELGLRLPSFGDNAISHPRIIDMDMRIVKPNATIKFTIDDGWYIMKGRNVRDYGYEQFHELSKEVLASRHYRDSTFSWGKEYIRECANRSAKRGNLTKWVQVGTNHHIEKVVKDIANFYASVSTP